MAEGKHYIFRCSQACREHPNGARCRVHDSMVAKKGTAKAAALAPPLHEACTCTLEEVTMPEPSPNTKLIWACIQCRDSIELKDDFSLDFIKENLDALDEFVSKHSEHRLHFTLPNTKTAEDYKENIEIMMGVLRERDRRKANG